MPTIVGMSIWLRGKVRHAYDDEGHGLPVVLVHGHPFDRSMWLLQRAYLSGRDFRVISPDLRGYGDSAGPPGVRTLDVFARDIAALMDRLQVPAAALCGLSMGGQVVLEFCRLFPDRVTALVLADTCAQAENEAGRLARHCTASRLLADGMSGYADEVLPKMISPASMATRPAVAGHVLEMMRGTSPAAAAAALHGRAQRRDYIGLLSQIAVPALIVVGAEDEFTPLSDAEQMHSRIPGATLAVIPGAAHLPNLEQPETFNGIVGAFLRSALRSELTAAADAWRAETSA